MHPFMRMLRPRAECFQAAKSTLALATGPLRLTDVRSAYRLVAIAVVVGLLGCGGATQFPQHPISVSFEEAQQQVPFRILVPRSDVLPPPMSPTPFVVVTRDHAYSSQGLPIAGQDVVSAEVVYRYHTGRAPAGAPATDPIRILETYDPSESRVRIHPSDAKTMTVDGRQVSIVESPVSGTLGLDWEDGPMSYELVTTLGQDDALRLFRSMTEGTPIPTPLAVSAAHYPVGLAAG